MKRVDFILLGTVIVLTLFGLLMVYDASSFVAYRDLNDKYHLVKDQLKWVFLGFTGLTFASFFNYKKFYNLSLPILIGSIVLLGLVFIPGLGVEALGASRWIHIAGITIQPTEFAKLALAIYLSAWFSERENGRFMAFSLLMGLVLLLVMLQPDMGTASIILFEALIVYFLSGGNLIHFFFAVPALAVLGFILIKLEPYRWSRLTAFMNLGDSLHASSYHVKQILIALGSGGVMGLGIGNSLQKYAYLPENTTDSIFAIIGEEFGFIGSVILILLFMVVIWRGFVIAMRTKDTFGRLLAASITSYIGIQMLINLGAMTALLPLTGVPLPFISYGGSALIINLFSIGIILNISKQNHK